ncbi:MAG: hypothetical protein RM338_12675 [Nostoc sp. DedQUE12a]|nr:hypothetical protein [Nostoc sp. DedQUE12a]
MTTNYTSKSALLSHKSTPNKKFMSRKSLGLIATLISVSVPVFSLNFAQPAMAQDNSNCRDVEGVNVCAQKKVAGYKFYASNPFQPTQNPNALGKYQLFWDGVQVGMEPSWTLKQAIANLEDNKKAYPNKKVEGLFNGQKVGYELIWDGVRVGFEPNWTLQQAIANLEDNKKAYPNKKVEGLFNGQKVGYELIWDGVRVGFEPSWTLQQAIANLEDNKKAYPNKKVEGLFNGKQL